MATIKSYTDLEQSKKLMDILPLESADMYYPWYIEDDGDTIESGHRITTPRIGNFTTHKVNKMILPCWSLAALISVLEHPRCFQGDKPTYWFCGCFGKDKLYHEVEADNPVDAAYKMILELNGLKI